MEELGLAPQLQVHEAELEEADLDYLIVLEKLVQQANPFALERLGPWQWNLGNPGAYKSLVSQLQAAHKQVDLLQQLSSLQLVVRKKNQTQLFDLLHGLVGMALAPDYQE